MASVEELLVILRANTSDFNTKFGTAEKQVAGFGATTSSGLQKFAAVGGVALAAVAVGAVAVGIASVKAADDFEASHARLENAVKKIGSSWDDEKGKIGEVDQKLEHFGFTNADTENAMSRLVIATGNVGKAQGLMGLAADISRARNISLASATDLLVKVEGNRFLGLSKTLGVNKKVIDSFNNSGDAVAYLTSKFGGAAQANADTFQGKMQVLDAELTDLAKNIGEAVIPVIEELASGLAAGVKFLKDNDAVAKALGITIAAVLVPAMATFVGLKVAAAASAISTAFGAALTAVDGLASGNIFLASSEGAVVAGAEGAAVAEGLKAVASQAAAIASGEAAVGAGVAAVAFEGEAATADAAAAGLGNFTAASLLVPVAIAAIVAVGTSLIDALRSITQELYSSVTGSEDAGKGIKIFGDALTAPLLGINNLLDDISGLTDGFFGLEGAVKDAASSIPIIGGLFDSGGGDKKPKNNNDSLASAQDKLAAAQKRAADAGGQNAAANNALADASAKVAAIQGRVQTAMDSTTTADKRAADAERALQTAIDNRVSSTIASFSSQIQAVQATNQLSEALKGNTDPLTLQQDLLSAAGAKAQFAADQYESLTGKTASAQQKSEFFKTALAQLGSQFPAVAAQAGAYEGQINATTKSIDVARLAQTAYQTVVKDPSMIAATLAQLNAAKVSYPGQAAEIQKAIDKIVTLGAETRGLPKSATIAIMADTGAFYAAFHGIQSVVGNFHPVINIGSSFKSPSLPTSLFPQKWQGGVIPGFASGGSPPGVSWVGEHGPELFVTSQGGRVLSHSDSMKAVSGGGGGDTYNVTVNAMSQNPQDVVDAFARYIRSNGNGGIKKLVGV